jgi:hypothetical protein
VAGVLLARCVLVDFSAIGWAIAQGNGFWLPKASQVVTFDRRLIVDDRYQKPYNATFQAIWQEHAPAGAAVLRDLSDGEEAILMHAGFELASTIASANDRIAVLAFANGFPVSLRLDSPKGVIHWLDAGRTWGAGKTPVTKILGDATLVMEPAFSRDWRNSAAAIAATRTTFVNDWRVVAQTGFWTVWRKKSREAR